MQAEIVRDGLKLRGRIERAAGDSGPALIIFHGFGGDFGYGSSDLYSVLAQKSVDCGVSTVRFDFSGYGKSDGRFEDMDLLRELLDSIAILQYVRTLPFVTEIYLLGHSQGGVVAGMLAGLYPEVVRKLILLAPAATLKEDAEQGVCMGTKYNTDHIPDIVEVDGRHKVGGHYFRIAKNLPVYEVTARFKGKTLLIHGTGDQLVDSHASAAYHACMPESKLCLYRNLDHGIEGADQEQALREIADFLLTS